MIDLHVHTKYSDGTDSLEELLEKAEEAKLEAISITDHDSFAAYEELEHNPKLREKFHGNIIIGSEIKAIFEGVNIEVLAYGVDYKKLVIKKENRQQAQNEILQHFIKVAKSLGIKVRDDLKVDVNDTSKVFACWVFCDDILQYQENESILKQFGEINRHTFYREHEGNKNSPFYYDSSKNFDDCKTLVNKIHEAGGLAFLAHGLLYAFEDKLQKVEKILTTTGIDGLECIHSFFQEEDKEVMINLCKKHHKLTSGGTDYHGKNKPTVFLGTGVDHNVEVSKEFVGDWIDQVTKI